MAERFLVQFRDIARDEGFDSSVASKIVREACHTLKVRSWRFLLDELLD